jgi:hypothetical protein
MAIQVKPRQTPWGGTFTFPASATGPLRAAVNYHGTVFTSVPGVGVYRRDPHEATATLFALADLPAVHDLLINPQGVPEVHYAGGRYVSEDDGETWQSVT